MVWTRASGLNINLSRTLGLEEPRKPEPQAKPEAKRERERETEEEVSREKVVKRGERARTTGREEESEAPATKMSSKKKPGTSRETEGDEKASKSRSPKKSAPTKQADPDSEARGTADPKTASTGTAADQAEAERARARKHRKRAEKIALIHRLRQRWGPAATVILQAIDRRERLRQAWDNVAKGLFAHHLVPVTVLKSNEVAQAAVVGGYDFNGKKNGALLTHPEHYGGHNEYNDLVSQDMDAWARSKGGRYTPQDAREFVEGRVPKWKAMYLRAGEYIIDTSDPGSAKR